MCGFKIQDDQVLFSYLSLFPHLFKEVKGRMVVTVPISLVQLPDIWVGKGSTTTGVKSRPVVCEVRGHPGAGAGSLQRGRGSLIFALPPGLPTERTAPTRAPCRGEPRRRPAPSGPGFLSPRLGHRPGRPYEGSADSGGRHRSAPYSCAPPLLSPPGSGAARRCDLRHGEVANKTAKAQGALPQPASL